MNLIEFENELVIIGGGDINISLLQSLHKNGASIIAADGGANICNRAGIIPEAIIGDMDSLKNMASWQGKSRLLKICEQETTDFEKCLYSTKAPLTIALGISGSRFDHMLAALDIVAKYAALRHIILVDEKNIALAIIGDFSFQLEKGEQLSIFPLGKIEFERSQGLLYPLDELKMELGKKISISNKTTGSSFSIEVKNGNKTPYLLIIDNDYLDDLIKKLVPS